MTAPALTALLLAALTLPAQPPPAAGLSEVTDRIRAGDFIGALRLVDMLMPAAPADPRLWTLKGLALAGLGQVKESLECYSHALLLDPGSLAALQAKAELEYRTEHPQARTTLGMLLHRQPANPVAHAMLASLDFASGDCKSAIAHFEKARAVVDQNAAALHQFGFCLAVERNPARAAEIWRRAIEMVPHQEGYYLDLATLYAEHGTLDAALEVLTAGVRNLPRSAALRLMRGIFLVHAGRFEEAEAEFGEADRLSPERRLGAVGLSYGSTQWQERLDRAIGENRRALGVNPADPLLNYLLGEALLRKGAEPPDPEFEEARRSLRRSVQSDPGFAKARTALAKTDLKLGRIHEAIRHLEIAVKADPSDQIALSTLAAALQRAGRPEQAKLTAAKLRAIIARERVADLNRSRSHPIH